MMMHTATHQHICPCKSGDSNPLPLACHVAGESLGYLVFGLAPVGMLSSNVTSISSPGCFAIAFGNVLVRGRNWAPSPQGMEAVWKGTPSIVPLTFRLVYGATTSWGS